MRIRPDVPAYAESAGRIVPDRSSAQRAPAQIVAPQKTPLSPGEIRASLQAAHQALKGKPIEPQLLDVLTAQVCTENAGGAAMHNHNFGGIKGKSPEGATAMLRTREVLDGKTVAITDGFRAYSSPVAGARDYLELLGRRFPRALEAAKTGDVGAYASRLKAGHYFTADAGEYASALRGVIARGFNFDMPSRSGNAAPQSFVSGPPDVDSYATTLAVARVMDAVSQGSARIAAPSPDD